jgi:tagatose-6-phosphate ketose/aldose isomerase
MLGRAGEAEGVAAKDPHRVVLLGTGPLEAAAEEGALKILEMTDGQVAVLARNFLEFRHGPLNFVDRKTVVLCFHSPVPGKRRYEDDLVAQVRKSGQVLDLVALEPEGEEADAALLAVVFAQMVALFLTLRRGLTPDLPGDRGLIHRVVQGVTIHPGGTA